MAVIDTSWLVALHNEEDEHHGKAVLQAGKGGPFLLPGVVLSEYLTLVYARTRALAGTAAANAGSRAAIRILSEDSAITVESAFPLRLAREIYEGDSNLSFADAVGVSVALTLGRDLLTFDEPQAKSLKAAKKDAQRPAKGP